MANGKYEEALASFLYLKDHGAELINLNYKIQVCNHLSSEKRGRNIDQFLTDFADFGSDPYFHYWNGKINLRHARFGAAAESFELFLSSPHLANESTNRLLEDSRKNLVFIKTVSHHSVVTHESPINTYFSETNPIFNEEDNMMVFLSDRVEEGFSRIYVSTKGQYGWNKPAVGTDIQGLAGLTNDDKSMVVLDPTTGTVSTIELIGGKLAVTQTETIVALKQAESFYVNKYRNRIIYSARNESGNTDLYEIQKLRTTGEWMAPSAIAGGLNTRWNETSPFLSEDRMKLYFSSDRPEGLGGLDIYVSVFDEVAYSWSTGENMGLPINSVDNEKDFRTDGNCFEGDFSSNRVGSKGDYDVYTFRSENVAALK